jgi:hypothetical protein
METNRIKYCFECIIIDSKNGLGSLGESGYDDAKLYLEQIIKNAKEAIEYINNN